MNAKEWDPQTTKNGEQINFTFGQNPTPYFYNPNDGILYVQNPPTSVQSPFEKRIPPSESFQSRNGDNSREQNSVRLQNDQPSTQRVRTQSEEELRPQTGGESSLKSIHHSSKEDSRFIRNPNQATTDAPLRQSTTQTPFRQSTTQTPFRQSTTQTPLQQTPFHHQYPNTVTEISPQLGSTRSSPSPGLSKEKGTYQPPSHRTVHSSPNKGHPPGNFQSWQPNYGEVHPNQFHGYQTGMGNGSIPIIGQLPLPRADLSNFKNPFKLPNPPNPPVINTYEQVLLDKTQNIVGWALLKMLLKNYHENILVPQPDEEFGYKESKGRIVRVKGTNVTRFIKSIKESAARVKNYINRVANDDDVSFVNWMIIIPIIDSIYDNGTKYITHLTMSNEVTEMNCSEDLSNKIYHLHTVVSLLYKTFFSAAFTYDNISLNESIQLGIGAIRIIIKNLFKINPYGNLEQDSLFRLVGENFADLNSVKFDQYVSDTADGDVFDLVSKISNIFRNIFINSALESLDSFAQVFPYLRVKQEHRHQVETLQHMRKHY